MTRISQCIFLGIGESDKAAFELVPQLVDKYSEVLRYHIENSSAKLTPYQDPNQQLLDTYNNFKPLANKLIVFGAYKITILPNNVLHTHRPGEGMWLIPSLESISRSSKIVETNFHCLQKNVVNYQTFIGSNNKKIVECDIHISESLIQ
jgi:hypothetical protein